MIPPVQFATARDGTRIAYVRIPGSSPPWLHLYSLGAPTIEMDFSVSARLGYITNLAQGRATILFDHRGSGFSGRISGALTLDDLVDDLAAVTAAVGEPMDVSVMGTGCLPAFQYLANGGPGWRSILIHGPLLRFAGSYQDRHQAIWRDGSYAGYLRAAARTTMDVSPLETETIVARWVQAVPEETAAAYMGAIRDVDLSGVVTRIPVPTLVTWPEGPGSGGARVAALIPGARLATISSPINRPELGTETRALWEAHIGTGLEAAPDVTEACGPLSAREHEVLALIAAGMTNPQIAEALVISPATAARHVHNILVKLGMSRRSEAVAYALREGLVE